MSEERLQIPACNICQVAMRWNVEIQQWECPMPDCQSLIVAAPFHAYDGGIENKMETKLQSVGGVSNK